MIHTKKCEFKFIRSVWLKRILSACPIKQQQKDNNGELANLFFYLFHIYNLHVET